MQNYELLPKLYVPIFSHGRYSHEEEEEEEENKQSLLRRTTIGNGL
jgi:hypothetical protein